MGQEPRKIKDKTGGTQWIVDGKMHREDGPAWITDEFLRWYKHGDLHREDGPALIWRKLTREEWYQNDKLHREDGPALVHLARKISDWYINGEKLTPEQVAERKKMLCRKEGHSVADAFNHGTTQEEIQAPRPARFRKAPAP